MNAGSAGCNQIRALIIANAKKGKLWLGFEIPRKGSSQMAGVEHNHLIQALPPDRANQPFDEEILPGTSSSDGLLFTAQRGRPLHELRAIDAIMLPLKKESKLESDSTRESGFMVKSSFKHRTWTNISLRSGAFSNMQANKPQSIGNHSILQTLRRQIESICFTDDAEMQSRVGFWQFKLSALPFLGVFSSRTVNLFFNWI